MRTLIFDKDQETTLSFRGLSLKDAQRYYYGLEEKNTYCNHIGLIGQNETAYHVLWLHKLVWSSCFTDHNLLRLLQDLNKFGVTIYVFETVGQLFNWVAQQHQPMIEQKNP